VGDVRRDSSWLLFFSPLVGSVVLGMCRVCCCRRVGAGGLVCLSLLGTLVLVCLSPCGLLYLLVGCWGVRTVLSHSGFVVRFVSREGLL